MTNQLEEEFINMVKDNKEDFYRLAYSYVKNEQDALDIVGEATYKGLNSLNKLRERKYMKTWFYRILINESIAVVRKNKTIVYDTEFIETITEDVLDKDEILDLYNSLDKLSHKYKTVIILKYMKQMRINEIAEILNMNSNTVKTRLKRGVDKLKLIMGGK
ncbi:sigma-70 family RNA polymerase sigma factor [Wukongibacter baidiensis]|uniref:sigma-70 family RNA polymerase sigma factor n=1 Tax=Wukongibacter baidiensis TaxID=1723361 RepID=UPI003D7F61FF